METPHFLKTKEKRDNASLKKNDKFSNTSTWQCQQCDEVFSSLMSKKKHEKFYHVVSKPFVCECGQQFGKLSEVKYHIRRIHNQEKNHVCPKCSKAFFKNSDLVSHLNTHEDYGKFLCKECGRRFKHVSNLIRHSRTHTGVKPYPCSVCNKRFSQIAALRQHQITEEHKVKVKVKCLRNEDVGGIPTNEITNDLPTKDGNGVSIHEKGEPSEKDGDSHKWWFYCKVCGERFKFSVLLRDHEIKHVLKKDIHCKSCEKNFGSVEELKNHACQKNSKDDSGQNSNGSNGVESKADTDDIDLLELPKEMVVFGENNTNELINESLENDKKVEVTLSQNGQILLDNDEVLLTLNDKVYGLLLINNDVTILESEENLKVMNKSGHQDFCPVEETEILNKDDIENVFNFNSGSLEKDLDVSLVNNKKLVVLDNWLWNEKSDLVADVEIPEDSQTIEPEELITKTEENSEEIKIEKLSKRKTPKTYTCFDCGKTFNKKGNYQQHLGVHSAKMQKYKCPECNRNFAWKSTLRKHAIKEHSERTQYSCQQCGKLYQSNLLVQHHIKRDHMNIRSHTCSFCGKSFFRRYDLKIHIRIHTNERPYVCGFCGKTFRHLSHSIRHEKTHLKDRETKAEKSHFYNVIMFNHNTLAV